MENHEIPDGFKIFLLQFTGHILSPLKIQEIKIF